MHPLKSELEKCQKFKYDKQGKIILSQENVILAETCFGIMYINSPLQKQYSSLEDGGFGEKIEDIIKTINKENSTHLSKHERTVIKNYIVKMCGETMKVEKLKELLTDKDYPLINGIRNLANNKKKGEKEKVRNNYSFATKFCHYSCFYLFEEDADKDLYSIYDSVLVDYLKKNHGFSSDDIADYSKYQSKIEEIISKGEKISRNGFDHLIWLTNRS